MKKLNLLFVMILLVITLASCNNKIEYDELELTMTNAKYEKYYNVSGKYNTAIDASIKPNQKDPYYIYSIEVKDGVEVVGSYSFDYMKDNFSISLPESTFAISSYAFYNTPLKEINTEKVKYFQEYSFYCDGKEEESKLWYGGHLPSLGIDYLDLSWAIVIEDNAFRLCNTEIRLTNNIKYIGDYAFSHSTLVGEIYIPNTIEYIGKEAFSFQNGNKYTYVRFGGTLDEFLKICPDSSWICKTEHSCTSKFRNFTIVCEDKQVLVGDLYPDYLEFLNTKDGTLH